MGNIAWTFPGQGSQSVGMGWDAAEQSDDAKRVFERVDDALGFALSEIIFNGPQEELVKTSIQQPAIVAASVAHFVALSEAGQFPDPVCVAGHSLGEYSALVAAGSLDVEDAVRLVRRRGQLMEEHGLGGMVAVIGLDTDKLIEIAGQTGVEIANFNAPGQITLSGRSDALEAASEMAKEQGARRVIPLPVNGAFHSSLMQPVADALWEDIQQVSVAAPKVPLLANVDARPLTDPDDLRAELRDHITASVQWIGIVEQATSMGVDTFYEIGPGKVLSGLAPRISRGCQTHQSQQMLAS
ncbi:MAG: [acyl-carrier-protein] S-malonyltransferase [Sphaerobacteraceae bacterium]|nr:MAG: [acyl-carrier-protein] S-malonyltransferase [Sphaerobacteraceae bacterium]